MPRALIHAAARVGNLLVRVSAPNPWCESQVRTEMASSDAPAASSVAPIVPVAAAGGAGDAGAAAAGETAVPAPSPAMTPDGFVMIGKEDCPPGTPIVKG